MRYRSRVYFETSSKERIHPRHEIEMENSFAEAKDLQDVFEQKIIFRIQFPILRKIWRKRDRAGTVQWRESFETSSEE
jgi:hypothetical protein